jgi:hypothetical protein
MTLPQFLLLSNHVFPHNFFGRQALLKKANLSTTSHFSSLLSLLGRYGGTGSFGWRACRVALQATSFTSSGSRSSTLRFAFCFFPSCSFFNWSFACFWIRLWYVRMIVFKQLPLFNRSKVGASTVPKILVQNASISGKFPFWMSSLPTLASGKFLARK